MALAVQGNFYCFGQLTTSLNINIAYKYDDNVTYNPNNIFVSEGRAFKNYTGTTGIKWDECYPYLKGILIKIGRFRRGS